MEFSQGNILKVNGNVTEIVRRGDFKYTFTSNSQLYDTAIFYDLGKTVNRYGFFDQSLGNINYSGTTLPTFKYNGITKNFSDIIVCKAFSQNKGLININVKICLVNDNLYFMCPYQNFSNRILIKLLCSQADVSFCNFSNCKLIGADFSGANLSNANLSGADLTGANLSGANLTGANLRNAILCGTNLSNCSILKAVLNNAKFNKDTNISNMLLWDNILKSSFTQTIPIVFDGASFGLKNNITLVSGTNLTENIAGRYIPNTSATPLVGNYKIHFSDNKLTFMIRNSDFTGRNFSGMNLASLDFTNCNFNTAKLSGTILSGANLSNANLTRADLTGANLCGANLSNCNILGAVLSSAKFNIDTNISNMLLWDNISKFSLIQTLPILFEGASFSLKNNIKLVAGTKLTDNIAARYIPTTSTTPVVGNYKIHFSDNKLTFMIPHSDYNNRDFSGMNLKSFDFTNSKLNSVKLNRTNLSGANLSGANLSQADLSNANLTNANLSGANLSNCNIINATLNNAKFNKNTNISNMLLWNNNSKLSLIQTLPILFEGTSFSLKNNNINITLVSGTNLTQDIQGRYIPDTTITFTTPVEGSYKIHFSANKLTFMIPHSDYNNRDFSGMYYKSFDFTNCKLKSAKFNKTDLSSANLTLADLSNAILAEANLTGANLNLANLSSVNFTGANLSGSNLSNSIMTGSIINNAEFNKDTNILNITLWDDKLKSSLTQIQPIKIIKNSNDGINLFRLLYGTNEITINGTSKFTKDIQGAYKTKNSATEYRNYKIHVDTNFQNMYRLTFIIPYTNLNGRDLSYNDFDNIDLTNCNFSGIDLTGCNFINSKIDNMIINSSTNIRNLILWDEKRKLSFSQTTPILYIGNSLKNGSSNIDLPINSNLTTDIVGQYYSTNGSLKTHNYKISYKDGKLTFLIPYTKLNKRIFNDLDLSNVDLTGSDFTEAKLKNTNMSSSNLKNCNFQYCNFEGCNFSGSDISYSNFTNAIIKNTNFNNTIRTGTIGLPS